MADAFGDQLLSVFEGNLAASGAKKSKAGATEGARRPGKRSEEKSSVAATGKSKREVEVDSTEDAILGKKPKLEDVSEDVNLTDLMHQVKVQPVETVEGYTRGFAKTNTNEADLNLKYRLGLTCQKACFQTGAQ